MAVDYFESDFELKDNMNRSASTPLSLIAEASNVFALDYPKATEFVRTKKFVFGFEAEADASISIQLALNQTLTSIAGLHLRFSGFYSLASRKIPWCSTLSIDSVLSQNAIILYNRMGIVRNDNQFYAKWLRQGKNYFFLLCFALLLIF